MTLILQTQGSDEEPFTVFPEHSILSWHLKRLSSPVQPLILPYHAEQVAVAFASTSSLEPTSQNFGSPLEVEKYFDVVAVVEGLSYNLDSDFSY